MLFLFLLHYEVLTTQFTELFLARILGFHMTSRGGRGFVSRLKDGFYTINLYCFKLAFILYCFKLAFILVGELVYIILFLCCFS